MISASTQCAEVAWYSYRVPGSQVSRHSAKRSSRLSRVAQRGGPSGAYGKPAVCSITCSTVTTSLPLVPNSGMTSTTRVSSATLASASNCHITAATNGLVAEKIEYLVSSVASPNVSNATSSPS